MIIRIPKDLTTMGGRACVAGVVAMVEGEGDGAIAKKDLNSGKKIIFSSEDHHVSLVL